MDFVGWLQGRNEFHLVPVILSESISRLTHGFVAVGAGVELFVEFEEASKFFHWGFVIVHADIDETVVEAGIAAVSYTHLTLPTICSV